MVKATPTVLACVAALAALACVTGACGRKEAPTPGMQVEPIPDDGRLPPGLEAMIFGGSRGCRDDLDCESNACVFGACNGLCSADEVWRVEHIGERVRARLALQPELRPILTDMLADVATREEMGLPFRGRAMRAIGEVYRSDAPAIGATGATGTAGATATETAAPAIDPAPAIAALKKLMPTLPASVNEVAAVTLARLGDASGVDIVIALTESTRLASACEALRALGHVHALAGAQRDDALVSLLAALSPDVDLELQRAAIDGLAAFGDKRAIRPLITHLTTGPEALADEVAAALRTLTGTTLGPDALKWDAWLKAQGASAASAVPEPPAYTQRGSGSLDDIDLPTP